MLAETVVALLRNPSYCVYGNSSSKVVREAEQAERMFNSMTMEEVRVLSGREGVQDREATGHTCWRQGIGCGVPQRAVGEQAGCMFNRMTMEEVQAGGRRGIGVRGAAG